MKKYKIRGYIFLIIFLILVISFVTYRVISANTDNNKNKIKEKAESEERYLDENLIKIFNQMNNIQFENYKISISKVNTSNTETSQSNQKNEESGKGSKDTSGGKESEMSEDSKGEKANSQSSTESESDSSDMQKTYKLQEQGILIQSEDIDWTTIKTEIENIYLSLPTITLDLYQTNIKDQDILDFNTEYDKLTKIVQEQNKTETLKQLVKLYQIYVKFVEGTTDKQKEIILAKTKLNILKAYSQLDSGNWEEISNNIKSASDEYSKLMTTTNLKEEKQYTTNKIYIMINELKNATDIKDSKIFLIKYRNTLEEIRNM